MSIIFISKMQDGLGTENTLTKFQFLFPNLLNSALLGENISGKLLSAQRKF